MRKLDMKAHSLISAAIAGIALLGAPAHSLPISDSLRLSSVLIQKGLGACTGTFISPTLVVTAESCIADDMLGPSTYYLGTMADGSTRILGLSSQSHHQLKNNVNLFGDKVDVAFLVVQNPFNQSKHWAPLASALPEIDWPWAWADVHIVGYHSAQQDGSPFFTDMRLIGTWGFSDEELHILGPTGPCREDGGAAAYDQDGRLIGIYSRPYYYWKTDCTPEGGSIFVNLTNVKLPEQTAGPGDGNPSAGAGSQVSHDR